MRFCYISRSKKQRKWEKRNKGNGKKEIKQKKTGRKRENDLEKEKENVDLITNEHDSFLLKCKNQPTDGQTDRPT